MLAILLLISIFFSGTCFADDVCFSADTAKKMIVEIEELRQMKQKIEDYETALKKLEQMVEIKEKEVELLKRKVELIETERDIYKSALSQYEQKWYARFLQNIAYIGIGALIILIAK